MATQTLTIGGIDDAATRLLEDLTLPLLDDIEAVSWMADALMHAIKERRGVICVGSKGSGKTVALDLAIARFLASEREIKRASAKYRRRRIVHLRTVRGEKPRDVLTAIFRAATGHAPAMRIRGRMKTIDELTEEVITTLSAQRVALIVVDEAETLSASAVGVLRDILSVSESTTEDRYTAGGKRPAGVGILLVGTWETYARMSKDDEAKERWARVQEIGAPTGYVVADIYRRLFPAFEDHARIIGVEAWDTFIHAHVSQGREVSLRLIENHIRAYARRMLHLTPEIRRAEQFTFNEEVFLYTLSEVQWVIRKGKQDAA